MESYLGQILMVGFSFAPPNYLMCNGQILNISDYDTLFNLIGTTYGGDGQTTFALPDLRSRAPIHQGHSSSSTYPLGATGGFENVTLTSQQLPTHSHQIGANGDLATASNPSGQTFAADPTDKPYENIPNPFASSANMLQPFGGNTPHSNIQPSLAITFMICVFGIYPSQS